MARIIPPQGTLFGPLLESGTILKVGDVLREARREREDAERKQAGELNALITELTNPALAETEQANLVQRKVDLIPDRQFQRLYGISKDKFLAGLAPATGTEEATARDAGLPPQSPQQGAFGPRVARPGIAPEQRVREAVATQEETKAEKGQLEVAISKAELNRIRNDALVRLGSGPDAPRKSDGTLMTFNERKQFLEGATDDPATVDLLSKVTYPGPMQTMVNEVTEIVRGIPGITNPEVFAKKYVPYIQVFHPQAMAALKEMEAQARINHLNAMIAVSSAKANKVVNMTDAQEHARQKEIDDLLDNARARTTSGIESFGGFRIDKDGVKIPGTTFMGVRIPFTGGGEVSTSRMDSPVDARHWVALFHPLTPQSQDVYRELGLEPPDGNSAVSEEDIESLIQAFEQRFGHTIDKMQIADTTKAGGVRTVSRNELITLALTTRMGIVPRYRELVSGENALAAQAFEGEEATRQAVRALAEALGTSNPDGADVDTLTGESTDPAVDAFNKLLGDYMQHQDALRMQHTNRLQELQQQLKRTPMTPEEIEADVDADIEELDRREREER